MGTRADFYVGKGKDAEWIGSIAWDGNRDGIDEGVLNAHSEEAFRSALNHFFDGRDDVTTPDMGWPWPWDTSQTTDCHYWFFDGRVWEGRGECERFGEVYVPADEPEPDWGRGDEEDLYTDWMTGREAVEFPNMKDRKNVAMDNRSGVIFITT